MCSELTTQLFSNPRVSYSCSRSRFCIPLDSLSTCLYRALACHPRVTRHTSRHSVSRYSPPLLLSIRLRSRACSLYPADSTPCPADTLLPKRVADLISLHFAELIHSVFASLQLNGSDTIFHYGQQGCTDSSQIFPQLLPSSPRNPVSSKSTTTFPRRRCLSDIAIQTMVRDLQM